MNKTVFATLAASMLVGGGAAAQSGEISIVSAGSEQAIKLGKTILSRPFGAQLVDRLAIVGGYSAADGRLYLVRGESGGACPARYVVIVSKRGADPRLTEPFGTCSAAARAAVARGRLVVTMPATVAGGPAVRFEYASGAMRLIDARPAAQIAASPQAPLGFAPSSASSCRSAAGVDADTQAETIADFEQSYPAEYRKLSSLGRAEIAPAELHALVVGLACLSTWPGAEQIVPRLATPLFASKRYGSAAFDALDTTSRDSLSDVNMRASVRLFSAEMTYRVGRRTAF